MKTKNTNNFRQHQSRSFQYPEAIHEAPDGQAGDILEIVENG